MDGASGAHLGSLIDSRIHVRCSGLQVYDRPRVVDLWVATVQRVWLQIDNDNLLHTVHSSWARQIVIAWTYCREFCSVVRDT